MGSNKQPSSPVKGQTQPKDKLNPPQIYKSNHPQHRRVATINFIINLLAVLIILLIGVALFNHYLGPFYLRQIAPPNIFQSTTIKTNKDYVDITNPTSSKYKFLVIEQGEQNTSTIIAAGETVRIPLRSETTTLISYYLLDYKILTFKGQTTDYTIVKDKDAPKLTTPAILKGDKVVLKLSEKATVVVEKANKIYKTDAGNTVVLYLPALQKYITNGFLTLTLKDELGNSRKIKINVTKYISRKKGVRANNNRTYPSTIPRSAGTLGNISSNSLIVLGLILMPLLYPITLYAIRKII